jgi:beta-ketoacyl-acyl-carrier-protein synthase II
MNQKRVVVTGMGLLSPVGHNVEESWQNIKNGVSGIDTIRNIDTSAIAQHIAGEVKGFDAAAHFGPKEARRLDRVTQFAVVAAQEALTDSGITITEDNAYDIACVIGTGIGPIDSLMETLSNFKEKGHRGVNPTTVPSILSDNIAARVSMQYGIMGANYTIITACATGNNCIGEGAGMIQLGRAKMVLAGGSEAAIVNTVLSGFNNMKALSQYDGEPNKACRPFDLHRDGFVAAEGAAVLMLEDHDHALARGAKIYAEITGYGHTSDAYHVTAPREDGKSAAKAMSMAIASAGLQATQIDYINAHGTGTPLNDKSETLAIKLSLGEHAYQVPVSSTKSMTGHILGATSAAETIFSILSIRDNFVPPTINLETPDPDCDLDYTPLVGRGHAINHVMNNSFGFGGHNAVVVVSRYMN